MTAKLFTGGLDSKDEAKKLPEITGTGADSGEKARMVGDGDNRIDDRYLRIPEVDDELGKIDLSLGGDTLNQEDVQANASPSDVEATKVKAKNARIKWTSSLLDRIAAVKEETGDVKDRIDRMSRRLGRFK